ncbi:MAG TPA: Ig-like domain repeat protein [Verrucomicrobiae bacterium]|jgi:autotransporter-associated beta strand protein
MKITSFQYPCRPQLAAQVFFSCLMLLLGVFRSAAQTDDFNSRRAALLSYYDATTPIDQTGTGEYRIGRTGFFFADARFLTNDLLNGSNFMYEAVGDADSDGHDSGFSMWPAMDCYLRWNANLPSVFTPTITNFFEMQLTTNGTIYNDGTTPNQEMMLSTARYFAGLVWGTNVFPAGPQFQASYGTGDPTGKTYASNVIVNIPLYGMLEHDSPIYAGDTLGPIYTLARFAPDPILQHKAQMTFDWIVAEISGHYFYDNWAVAADRTFPYWTQNSPTETAFMSYLLFGGPVPANYTNSYVAAQYCMPDFPGILPETLMSATNRSQPYAYYSADMEFTGLWNIGYYKTSYITPGYAVYSQAECDVQTNSDGSFSITNFGTAVTSNMGEMQRWGVTWNDPAHQTKFWITNPYDPIYSGSGGHYIGSTPFEEVAQLGGTIAAVYNMPTNFLLADWNHGGDVTWTNFQGIEGSIPTNYLALINYASTSGRIFLHYTNVLISLYISTNFTWKINPGNTTYFTNSAHILGVAVETASPNEYTQSTAALRLSAFATNVLIHSSVNTNLLTGLNPGMIYTDRNSNTVKIVYGEGAWTNGQLVDYQQWPTISNPWMYQAQLGNLFIYGTNRTVLYNYNAWTETTNYMPTLSPTYPVMISTASNATVNLDLATIIRDTETPSNNLFFTVGSPTNGSVTLLSDGHTASFTPTNNYGGMAAGFSFTTSDYGIDPRLVLYYDFATPDTLSSNLIADVSGNGRDGSIMTVGFGAAAYNSSMPAALAPFLGQSLQLPQSSNGSDTVCLQSTVTTGDLSMTNGSWTFATWFNRASRTNDNFILYAGMGDGFGGSGDELQLYCPSNSDLIALSHWNASNVRDIALAPTNVVSTNQWHHAAVVFQHLGNGTNNVSLYLDGALVSTASNIVWALHQDYPLVFGGHNSSSLNLGRWFNGSLADLALFRGALSSTEIADLATRTVSHLGGWTVTNGITVWVGPLSAINLTNSDASGSSSFNSAGNWSSGAAPLYTNAYFTKNFLLRTPPGNANYNFAGNSLTITNGGELSLKGNGTNTINNLIMAGGSIAEGVTEANPDIATLAGNINLAANTTVTSGSRSVPLTLVIQAPISNASGPSSTLTLSDTATTDGLTVVLAGQNTFSGDITVAGSPGDTLQLGINNALPSTVLLTLNGISTVTNTTVLDLNGYSTSVSGLIISNNTYPGFVTNSTTSPAILSISNNSPDTVQYGVISDNSANGGTLSLIKIGSDTLTLANTNTYSGTTTISSGTLTLGNSNAIAASTSLSIAAGAILDVSAFSVYAPNGGLSASGSASAATIKSASSGTVVLGSHTITLTYDGSHPALTLSQGTLSLSGNAFIVNGPVLTNGTYTIIQQTTGNITHIGTFSVSGTATGSGNGNLDSISISNGKVILTIAGSTTTTCTTIAGSDPNCAEDLMIFTATVANNNTGTTPTGKVIFQDGSTALFTNTLSSGMATCTNTFIAGLHSIVAYYQGDTTHNTSNSSNNPVSVSIYSPPLIISQPTNLSVAVNTSATFSVIATGTDLSYQWYFNNTNTPMPGAIKPTFTLSSAAYPSAGVYFVVVSNPTCTSVTSSNATLQVNTVETLIASDSITTSSLTGITNWTPSTTIAPTNTSSSTNDYYTSTFNLRSPATTNGVNYTTLAKSLNITPGGTFSIKGNGTNTISNLVLAGGSLSQGESGAVPDVETVAGSINLAASSTITSGATTTNNLTLIIQAPITNAPNVNATLTMSDDVGKIFGGLVVVLAGQSTFNGNIVVTGSPGDLLQLGINNALPPTAPLTLSGVSSPTNTTVLDLNGYSTSVGSLIISSNTYPGYVTNSATTSGTLSISNNSPDIIQYGIIADNGADGGSLSLTKTGSDTLTLANTNTYTGTTTVNAGTLMLSNASAISDSTSISIAAGATLDVSAISSYAVNASLRASGTASAAVINGASGGVVNLNTNSITLAYDGSDPALTISQGTLSLSNNTFTVNGPTLSNSVYTLVQQATGSITHLGTFSVSGSAIPSSGTVNSISVTGNSVLLTIIENTTTTCALTAGSSPNCQGDPLIFTATVANNGATGTTPTGNVVFKDGNTVLATVALTNGTASYTNTTFAAGSHSITVSYQGDTNHNTSDSSAHPVSVTVDNAPNITTQPITGLTNASGTTATFLVVATGTALSYQWYFNSTALSGATSSTLTQANAQVANSGVYYVVVSNPACDPATSSHVILLITNTIETLKANDSVNTSSFTGTTNWTPAPLLAATNANAYTNDYYTGTFILRSPGDNGIYNFAGDSLTVNTSGELSLKGNGTNIVNNLIMAGGSIAQGVTSANPDTATLAGNINLTADTTITSGSRNLPLTLVIQAPITNASGVNSTLTLSDTTTTNGLIVILAARNTFKGGIIVTGSPGDTLKLGINNALPPTASLALTGISTATNTTIFDLNSNNTAIGSLVFSNATYPGFVTNSATSPAILSISNNSADTVQYGVIGDNNANGGTLSLLKTGSGTLTLSNTNTYAGSTTVNAGILTLNGPGMSTSLLVTNGVTCYVMTTKSFVSINAAVSIGTGSQIYLTNGVSQKVKYLAFNGQWQSSGTWGSATSSATHKTNYFSGTGLLNVTSGGTPPAVQSRPIKKVAVIGISGSPSITPTFWSSNLILSWPSNLIGVQLQVQTNGIVYSNWTDVTGTTTTNQVIVPIDPVNGSVFYRLAP